MPDVGLLTATEPLPKSEKVVIRYSLEVGGLPVYQESYDVDTLAKELSNAPEEVFKRWQFRILCAVRCRHEEGFSACLTRCLTDGQACPCGHEKEAHT